MNLKKSCYNIEIDTLESGETLIFNSYSTALVLLNKELYNLYNQDILSYDNVSREYFDDIQNLVENGILIDCNIDEIERIRTLGNFKKYRHNGELYLTIVPTMNCNMRCSYCFQNDDGLARISKDMCNKVIDFIRDLLTNKDSLHICWFGGEPLLALDEVIYMSKKIIDMCNSKNIVYYSNIITNGYLLTNDIVKELIDKCKISAVQITLDGLGERHDSKRILKNGDRSFDTIVKNIENICDDINVVIRVNVDNENILDIENLIDYLMIEKNLKGKIVFGFSPVLKFESKKDRYYNSYCNQNKYDKFNIDILKKISDMDTIENVSNAYFQASTVACSANIYDNFVIDPKGNLYKCLLTLGHADEIVGNIDDALNNRETLMNKQHNRWLDIKWNESCHNCEVLPLCHSGCAFQKNKTGQVFKCMERKNTFKDILKMYCKEFERSL